MPPKVMLVGLVVAMLVPAFIIGALVVSNLGEDPVTAATTTTAAPTLNPTTSAGEGPGLEPTIELGTPEPSVATTSTTSSIPENTEISDNTELIPDDFPVPQGAVLDRGVSVSGEVLVYNIAGSPDNLVGTYSSFEDWTVVSSAADGVAISLIVSDGDSNMTVVGEPVENTAGVEITKLTITPGVTAAG